MVDFQATTATTHPGTGFPCPVGKLQTHRDKTLVATELAFHVPILADFRGVSVTRRCWSSTRGDVSGEPHPKKTWFEGQSSSAMASKSVQAWPPLATSFFGGSVWQLWYRNNWALLLVIEHGKQQICSRWFTCSTWPFPTAISYLNTLEPLQSPAFPGSSRNKNLPPKPCQDTRQDKLSSLTLKNA